MKPERKLLLTFDYELFFGANSGTVEACMIRPTDALLQLMKQHNAHGIFFVDATLLWQLKTQALKHSAARKDYEAICSQVQNMVKLGHEIALHLHPSWIDGIYTPQNGHWNLANYSRYAFSQLTESERQHVFTTSYHHLLEIIQKAGQNHIFAFRAGGLYIQPFAQFKPFLQQFGITYDFSVLKGFYSDTSAHTFDFKEVTTEPFYRFDNDVCLPAEKGSFVEIAIHPRMPGIRERIRSGLEWRSMAKFYPNLVKPTADGASSGIVLKSVYQQASPPRIAETYSVELMNKTKAEAYYKDLKNNQWIHFLSHPKLFSKLNLTSFNKFLLWSYKNYSIINNYKTWC